MFRSIAEGSFFFEITVLKHRTVGLEVAHSVGFEFFKPATQIERSCCDERAWAVIVFRVVGFPETSVRGNRFRPHVTVAVLSDHCRKFRGAEPRLFADSVSLRGEGC